MKEHFDSRLPDYEKKIHDWHTKSYTTKMLPHTMTLIVFRLEGFTGGELVIKGKTINPTIKSKGGYGYYNDKHYVYALFSLNCPHEVKPVLTGVRHAFTFPIYGTYDPAAALARRVSASSSFAMKDIVLEKLKEELANRTNEDIGDKNAEDSRAQLQGYVAALDDYRLTQLFKKYRRSCGDYIYESGNYHDSDSEDSIVVRTHVTYTLDGKTCNEIVYDRFTVPADATNISIHLHSRNSQILESLIEYVEKMEEQSLTPNRRDSSYDSDVDVEEQDRKGTASQPNVPTESFILTLSGRYFKDSKVDDLTPEDLAPYKLLVEAGRPVKFVPTASYGRYSDSSELSKLFYHFSEGQFKTGPGTTKYVSSLDVEFDDQGGYDPHYSLAYAVLCVT